MNILTWTTLKICSALWHTVIHWFPDFVLTCLSLSPWLKAQLVHGFQTTKQQGDEATTYLLFTDFFCYLTKCTVKVIPVCLSLSFYFKVLSIFPWLSGQYHQSQFILPHAQSVVCTLVSLIVPPTRLSDVLHVTSNCYLVIFESCTVPNISYPSVYLDYE